MATLIYIGDDLLDLYPDTVVAQTLKANEVGDLSARNFDYTNQFKVPFTPNNDAIYQNARNISSQTTIPYTRQTVRIVQGGLETISNGIHVLKKASKSYEMYILSGAADFFDEIKSKKITDLDLSALTIEWDPDALMNETTGVIFPVIDYGGDSFDGTAMDSAMNLPSMYYHTIINQIFTDAGFAKSGAVFSLTKYLNLIMPFGKSTFSYDGSFVQTFDFSAIVNTNQVEVNPILGTVIDFLEIVKTSDYFTASVYTHDNTVTMYGDFYAELTYTFSGGIGFTIEIRSSLATLATANGTPAGGTLILDSRTLFPDGAVLQDTVAVSVITTATVGTITITGGKFYNNTYSKAVAIPAIGDTAFGKLLPDMLQTDLIKDFMVRFNLLAKVDGGTVYFKSVDEIITDTANGTDWTNKRANVDEDEVTFTPLDYAQNNYFRYSHSDDLVNEVAGRGNMTVANTNIEADKDIYTSPFNNTLTELVGDVLVARIPIYDTSTDRLTFDKEPGLRLLLVRDKYSFEPTINGETAYKVAYFEDPSQTDSMSFQQLLDNHYPLFTAALQKAKVVKRKYLLTEADIANMDFFVPVFDTDSFFLKNTVGPFVPGRVCECELLKI